jgi:anti-anti-sigma factor
MDIAVERTADAVVVRLTGKLVAGGTEPLQAEIAKLIPTTKHLVLDLSELAYMDSMGLGTIIRLYVSAKSAGCHLELINLGKRVRELLGMTNVLSVFTTCGEHNIRLP